MRQYIEAFGRTVEKYAGDAVKTLIARARAVFARIDATGWVREADQALAPRE